MLDLAAAALLTTAFAYLANGSAPTCGAEKDRLPRANNAPVDFPDRQELTRLLEERDRSLDQLSYHFVMEDAEPASGWRSSQVQARAVRAQVHVLVSVERCGVRARGPGYGRGAVRQSRQRGA